MGQTEKYYQAFAPAMCDEELDQNIVLHWDTKPKKRKLRNLTQPLEV